METNNWKWFKLSELFHIKKGKRLTEAERIDGDIPYIGAIDSNNGLSSTISNNEHIHSANTITVSYNGSVAEAYYQPCAFWATDDVNVLYPRYTLNLYIALFLTTIINKEKYKFNYGRKWKKELMEVSKIKLPVDTSGKPNWQYMEDFIKNQLNEKLPNKTQSIFQNSFDKAPILSSKFELNTQHWKSFRIKDLFNVKAGKYHYPAEYTEGETPYISATAENNGMKEKISLIPDFAGNVITIEKVKCTAFYQTDDFCATSDVNILKPKNFTLNKFSAMFIISVIEFNESFRWTYGRQCRVNDSKNIRIKLPVDSTGNPDWEFMENYIKSLPYSKNL